jgi:four helix bundle protein
LKVKSENVKGLSDAPNLLCRRLSPSFFLFTSKFLLFQAVGQDLVSAPGMSAQKPRDLCERTFLFACDIVSVCRTLSKEPGAPRQISGQLLRAGTSVGADTEEAKAAYTRSEFAFKNCIVLRECRESRYWLNVIAATRLAPPEAVTALIQEANELVGIFTQTVRKAREPLKVKSEK